MHPLPRRAVFRRHRARREGGAPGAPNLTLLTRGNWTQEDFTKALRTGVNRSGKQLDTEFMPWERFAKLTDREIAALWLFISSLQEREFGQ